VVSSLEISLFFLLPAIITALSLTTTPLYKQPSPVSGIDKNFLFVTGSIRNVDLYVKKILTTRCGLLH
jgi:hypothetical protein